MRTTILSALSCLLVVICLSGHAIGSEHAPHGSHAPPAVPAPARIATTAPVITSPSAATGTVGSFFSYQIIASQDPTGFSASGLPAGLVVDPATGVISGVPQVAGVSLVTLRASNALGIGSTTLSLSVNGSSVVTGPPVISSAGSAHGIVGVPFSYQITASQDPVNFNATGLPTGLRVDLLSGVINGTPQVAGTSLATISASNGAGTGSAPLNIIVSDPSVVTGAPVISSPITAGASVGTPFSYQIVASQQPTSYSASGLPSGLVLNPTTGAITGTPVTIGTYPVTLGAANSLGSGSQTTTITVVAAGQVPPSSTSTDNDGGSCGAGSGLSAALLALFAALRLCPALGCSGDRRMRRR